MLQVLVTSLKNRQGLPAPRVGGGLVGMVARILRWQLAARLWPGDLVFDFVSGSVLVGRKGLTLASSHFYFGFANWHISPFILHALRRDDRFIDIGANIGVDTILGAAVRQAHVVACEPSSATFRYLQRNVRLNGVDDRVTLRQIAIGENSGSIAFETNRDALNRVVTQPLREASHEIVPVETLDAVAGEEGADILKIDVLGYEPFVLRGGQETLRNSRLRAIIIGVQRRARDFGQDPLESSRMLSAFGFQPVFYDVSTRRLVPIQSPDVNQYVLFVRDPDEMQRRLSNAESFELFGTRF